MLDLLSMQHAERLSYARGRIALLEAQVNTAQHAAGAAGSEMQVSIRVVTAGLACKQGIAQLRWHVHIYLKGLEHTINQGLAVCLDVCSTLLLASASAAPDAVA